MSRTDRTQTMSSRDFNQHTGRAKLAADQGPVMITDRGRPAYVLLRYEDFRKLVPGQNQAPPRTLADLADPRPEADFAFDIPRRAWPARVVEFDS